MNSQVYGCGILVILIIILLVYLQKKERWESEILNESSRRKELVNKNMNNMNNINNIDKFDDTVVRVKVHRIDYNWTEPFKQKTGMTWMQC